MASINLTLPLINCPSCNTCIGHLIEKYKKILAKLNTAIEDGIDILSPSFDDEIFLLEDGRNVYTSFIKIFYTYADDEDKKLFDIKAILIYALLSYSPLTEEDFPFRKVVKRYKWCCSRMFLCDPTCYP
jgi:DNA-directed RNA polymerase subunit N (RpoN/RPB10)